MYCDSIMREIISNFLVCTVIYLSYVNLTIQLSQFDEYPPYSYFIMSENISNFLLDLYSEISVLCKLNNTVVTN